MCSGSILGGRGLSCETIVNSYDFYEKVYDICMNLYSLSMKLYDCCVSG